MPGCVKQRISPQARQAGTPCPTRLQVAALLLDLAQQAAQLSHLPCRQLPAACAPGGRGLDGQSGLGAAAVAAAGAAVDQAGVL